MYPWIAVVLPFFAASTLGATMLGGSTSSVLAEPLVNGTRVTQDLYANCKYEAGDKSSESEECVVEAVKIMVALMRSSIDISGSKQGVVLLNKDNHGQVPTITAEGFPTPSSDLTDDPTLKSKRNALEGDEILQGINGRLLRRSSGGREIRAVEIGNSEMHFNGGRAIRTNVHDGDAALHVHTNGSHAIVAFKRRTSSSIRKRDGGSQGTPSVEFLGMQGFKMAFELVKDMPTPDLDQEFDDLETGLINLVGGQMGNPPKMRASDAFAIATCRKSNGEMGMRGKLVSLDTGAGYDFEQYGLINCDNYAARE
jgi:hypothetical protein